MRTTLPLPEQEGFRVHLPSVVNAAPGTEMERDGNHLRLKRQSFEVELELPPPAVAAVQRRLESGWSTEGLAATWRQALERLMSLGLLDSPCGAVPGLVNPARALTRVFDAMEAASAEAMPPSHPLNEFVSGSLPRSVLPSWIRENYRFTKAAAEHVAPVLRHPMSTTERTLWERFLHDESWHWRIYRPVFAQLRLSMQAVDSSEPLAPTSDFIRALKAASSAGPVEYAAVMLFVERPPMVLDADADPLFRSLKRNYGLTESSLTPLWWHATENLQAGHSALGAVVMSNRGYLREDVVESACAHVGNVVRSIGAWQAAILRVPTSVEVTADDA